MINLLIHSAIYEAPEEYDRDGNATWSEPVTLENIRVNMELEAVRNTEGEAEGDKGTLYYMPGVSTPAIIPAELARVTWQGQAFTIRKVYPCYTRDGGAVHHYEAALI